MNAFLSAFNPQAFRLKGGTFGVAAGSSGNGPTGFAVATTTSGQLDFSWDADANLGYAIYVGVTNVFASAVPWVTNIPASSTSHIESADQTQNPDNPPPPTVGSKYYYWLVGTDGAGTPVTDPSNVVSARAFVTLPDTSSFSLQTPDGDTYNLVDLFFGTTQPVPLGVEVYWDGATKGALSLGNGTWEDAVNGGDPYNPVVSGLLDQVTNNSGSDFTFWNAEP